MTLQHIVLFSFPSALSAEDEAKLRAMVASWPREIGGWPSASGSSTSSRGGSAGPRIRSARPSRPTGAVAILSCVSN
jgi:hypothetical protein